MTEEDIQWVRDTFSSGRAAMLRLLTDHTVHDCGRAAGTSGGAWWRFENGELITDYRAEALFAVLRKLQNGERLEEVAEPAARAEASTAPPEAGDENTKQTRHEIALLVAAETLMNLSAADLVRAAPTWDSAIVRETRNVARRALRRRILDLGGEAPTEEMR